MNDTPINVKTQNPTRIADKLFCPCGEELRFVESNSSMDDTAIGRQYRCDAVHFWVDAQYKAWPDADGWYFAGTERFREAVPS